MKTIEELLKLDLEKLLEELNSVKTDLFKVTFDVKNDQSKNTHKIRDYKKQIARIATVIQEKETKNKQ